jgi:PEP-CTERM motif-containing protein
MRSALFGIASVLVVASVPAHAVPIVTTVACGTTHACATSILGLEVGGTEYDVTFSLDSYNSVLATNPGVATFLGSPSLASAAALAMTNAFNSLADPSLATFLTPTGGWGAAYIAQQQSGSTVGAQVAFSYFVHTVFTTAGATNDPRPWAIFTPTSSVPEPGTLSLLTVGLLFAAGAKRRRSSSATRQ